MVGSVISQQHAGLVDGMTSEWRDEFSILPGATGSLWSAVTTTGSVLVGIDGNAAGASYLKLTLDPRDPTAQADLIGTTALAIQPPYRQGWGVSLSRRTNFMHVWFGQVGCDAYGVPTQDVTPPASGAITGGMVVVSNIATVTTTAPHSLVTGQRVALTGFTDPRVNGFYTVSSVVSPTSFTFAYTIGNATYGTTGNFTAIPASLGYQDCLGVIASDFTSGNAVSIARAEGTTSWVNAWNPGNSWDTSTVPSNIVNYSGSYIYPHQARHTIETQHERDWVGWTLHTVDSGSGTASQNFRDQVIPYTNAPGGFIPRLQARNLPTLPVPLRITAASKSGSTTATLTIPSHGLTTTDTLNIYGIRDQTNFALSTSIPVASVPDANTITAVFGASATATSYGGFVTRIQQNSAPSTFITTSAIQSITTSATGRLQLTFAASQGTLIVGESVCLLGLVDSTNTPLTAYDGLYRVASTNTSTFIVELDPLQGQALPALTNAGGALLPAVDVRVHFVRAQAHSRLGVEIESGRATSRAISTVPVQISSDIVTNRSVNLAQVVASAATSALDGTGGSRALGVFLASFGTSADAASAARTTSGNSGTISSGLGQSVAAVINVTAVSGTNPTMDIVVQESYDAGVTWQDVYHLPTRITATGTHLLPPLLFMGRRRYAWTIGGSSPSFTFTITANCSSSAANLLRQIVDRTIAPNTTNAAGTSLFVDGCSLWGLIVTNGAGASVNPVYGVQFSADGTNWADSGISLTVPPSSTVGVSLPAGVLWPVRWARIYIKTGGTGATHTVATLTAVSS